MLIMNSQFSTALFRQKGTGDIFCSKWKIEGTPFEETQKRLHAKGLHDPWLRNEVWVYGLSDKHTAIPKV